MENTQNSPNTQSISAQAAIKPKYSLNTIYFYLTEGCNLNCRHCWIMPESITGDGKRPVLSPELFASILEQAKPLGLASVKLTGGEPFLHPRIEELIDAVKMRDLRLVIETNGVLCSEALAKKIKECKNPFVSVSFDGADAQTHEWVRGVKGSFEKAKEGMRNLVKAGLRPQIIMTIMRRNLYQIEAVVRMAESLGAGSVKFNIVQPTARGEKMHQANETLTIEELINLGSWIETDLCARTYLRLHHSHPPAFRPLGRIFGDKAFGSGLCGVLGIIGVLANGKYALCGIGETVPELVFGDCRSDRLEDIWNTNAVLNNLRLGMPEKFEGICADCIMKKRCLGHCVAQNYYTSRNLWAGYWYCQEAEKKGLFPTSRKRISNKVT
ncbi:MAG: SynChlorMet cassette radical SAM/SPASM protein ScmF [Candidatus Omnitrophica bacterium]|nr:SynChlorMet cassette radical SAM/SPASM protein ScmF [Candidatus Omnitrophota bacterium]